MINCIWNNIKNYKKTIYVSVGIGSLIIGFSSIGFLVKKKYIQLPSN